MTHDNISMKAPKLHSEISCFYSSSLIDGLFQWEPRNYDQDSMQQQIWPALRLIVTWWSPFWMKLKTTFCFIILILGSIQVPFPKEGPRTLIALRSWSSVFKRVISGWDYVGLNIFDMVRAMRSSYRGKHLLPESIKSSLLWCFWLPNSISSQLISPPVILTVSLTPQPTSRPERGATAMLFRERLVIFRLRENPAEECSERQSPDRHYE